MQSHSRAIDPSKTVAENMREWMGQDSDSGEASSSSGEARQIRTLVYETGASCGYDIELTAAENSLLITAKEK